MNDSLHKAAPYRYSFGERVSYVGENRQHLRDHKFSVLEVDEENGTAKLACLGDPSLDTVVTLDEIEPRTLRPVAEGPMVPPPPGGYVDGNPKTAAGARKPRFDAIPPSALVALGAVMDLGRRKYGLFNWREHPITASTYLNAAERHLLEFRDGKTFDVESGVIQLGHVMACCAIVIDAMSNGTITDDRSDFVGAMTDLIKAISEGEHNAICEPR